MESLKLLSDAVLKILVGYLEFALDLFSLQGLDRFVLSNKVSPLLLSYFIVGSTIAYVFKRSPEDKDEERKNFSVILLHVFIYAIGSHAILIAVSKIWPVTIGSARDTLNAWLASAAVMLPIASIKDRVFDAAILLFWKYKEKEEERERRWNDFFLHDHSFPVLSASRSRSDLAISVGLLGLAMGIGTVELAYCGLSLAYFHGVEPIIGLLPGLLFFFMLILVVSVMWLKAKIESWRRTRELRERALSGRSNPYIDFTELIGGTERKGSEAEGSSATPNPGVRADC